MFNQILCKDREIGMFRGANKNRSLILTLSKEKRAILGGKVLIFSGLLFEEGEGLIKNTHLPPSNFGFYLAVSGYFGDIPLFRSSTKMLKELRGRLIFQVAFAFYKISLITRKVNCES